MRQVLISRSNAHRFRWVSLLLIGAVAWLAPSSSVALQGEAAAASSALDQAVEVLAASPMVLYLGRFHPVVLHLPIGLLFALAAVELVAWRRRTRAWSGAAWLLLWLSALSAVVVAVLGLFLAWGGDYEPGLLNLHRWLGIAVAGLGMTLLACKGLAGRVRRAEPLYGGLLVVSLGVLGAAGHYGASLTHGSAYLTESMPPALARLVGLEQPDSNSPRDGATAPADVFRARIEPVLTRSCFECHGPSRQAGGLRLDSFAAATRVTEEGIAGIVAKDALASEVVRRITMAEGKRGVMPPGGRGRLASEEIIAIIDWINSGAGYHDPIEELARLTPPPAEADLAALRAVSGAIVQPLRQGSPLLRIELQQAGEAFGDEQLALLAPLAPNVLWLRLTGTGVSDTGAVAIAALANLTELHLDHTQVGDAGLQSLAGLSRLTYLNLVGTRVTDAGLESLQKMPTLRSLYLWNSNVTTQGLEMLRVARPELNAMLADDRTTATIASQAGAASEP